MILKKAVVVLWMLILIGCSGVWGEEEMPVPDHIREMENVHLFSQNEIASADSLYLVRDQVFGEGDEVLIGSIGQIVSDSFGRVLIGDSQQRTIHIFQKDGTYLTNIGRAGDGPGEFQWMGTMDIHLSNLYAYDPNGRKINVFDLGPDSESHPVLSNTINFTFEQWDEFPEPDFLNPGFWAVMSDGSMLLRSGSSPLKFRQDPDFEGVNKYYKTDSSGNHPPREVFEIGMPEHIITEWFTIPPPFAGREIIAFSESDDIYATGTDEILIKVHDSNGSYQYAIYYPYSRKVLTRSDAVQSVDSHEQLENAVKSMELPDKWPALRRMFVDDENRIWISLITESAEKKEWWVLKEDGKMIAQFELPESKSVVLVKDGFIYTRETDQETGLQQVVRNRFETEGS